MSSERASFYSLALRAALKQVYAESYLQLPSDAHPPTWLNLSETELLIAQLIHGANPPGVDIGNPLRLTEAQATRLAAEVAVLAQHPNDASGLSMTLLQERATGALHLAIRGTEFLPRSQGGDWERDGANGADGELLAHGLALAQLDAMREVYADWRERFGLVGERITVTGYSLGGHLAFSFAELFPDAIAQVFTFNSPSRGDWREEGSLSEILDAYRLARDQPESLSDVPLSLLPLLPLAQDAPPVSAQPGDNVYESPRHQFAALYVANHFELGSVIAVDEVVHNPWSGDASGTWAIYGRAQQNDTELVAGNGVPVPSLRLRIEDQPDFSGTGGMVGDIGSFGHTHALTLIIDSLLVHQLYATVFANISHVDIAFMLDASSGQTAESQYGLSEVATYESDTLERAVDHLARLFMGDGWHPLRYASGTVGYGDLRLRSEMHEVIEQILSLRADLPALTFDSLLGRSAEGLGLAAVDDLAVRYALWSLTPFVVRGGDDLYTSAARLALLNDLSNAYLRDRADFASALWQENASEYQYAQARIYRDLGTQVVMAPPVYESSHAAVIFGTTRGDHILGGAGRDRLYGDAGDDVLQGGDHHDRLEGGLGDDQLEGGLGEDELLGGFGFDIYHSGPGDQLHDSDGSGWVFYNQQILFGGLWDETTHRYVDSTGLFAYQRTGGNLIVYDHSGGSLLIQGYRAGDLGIDLRETPTLHPEVIASAASERIEISSDRLHLRIGLLSAQPEHIYHWRLANASVWEEHEYGQALLGLDAGGGDDVVLIAAGGNMPVQVLGGIGRDSISFADLSAARLLARGGDDDDGLRGSEGDDELFGDMGHDALFGGGGDDRLSGGTGTDLLSGGMGRDLLLAGSGRDLLLGGGGSDVLMGSAEDNLLYGDTDSSLMLWIGGALTPADDLSYYVGGLGRVDAPWSMLVDVAPEANGHDVIFAGAGNDELFGGGGNDRLHGEIGNDLLIGEAGDDQLFGGAGNDRLFGDTNHDQRSADARVIEGLTRPTANGLTSRFVRRQYTQESDAYGSDYLHGGTGDDLLLGGAGDDTYVFHQGDDLDRVIDSDGWDRLLLSGLSSNWRLQPDGDDLIFRPWAWLRGLSDDAIVLQDWFGDTTSRIEEVVFEDGERWMEADVRAYIPEHHPISAGIYTLGRGIGSYYTIDELLAGDQIYHLQDLGGFDWLSLRSPDVVDDLGRSLGLGQTAIDYLRREGNTLKVGVLVSPLVPLSAGTHGEAVDPLELASAQAATLPSSLSFAPFQIELYLHEFFNDAGRIEVLLLDELTLGGESAPPVRGATPLEPYAATGQAWMWRLPEGVFVEERTDLLVYDLRSRGDQPLPNWLNWDPVELLLWSDRTPAEAAWVPLEVRASDLSGNTVVTRFDLALGQATPPRFSEEPEAITLKVGLDAWVIPQPWALIDRNPDETFSTTFYGEAGRPVPWLRAHDNSGQVELLPNLLSQGRHLIQVRVVDGDGLVATANWQIDVGAPDADDLASGRIVIGTSQAEYLHGTAYVDLIQGGRGSDVIDGGGGDDVLHLERRDGIDTVQLYQGAHMHLQLGEHLAVERLRYRIESPDSGWADALDLVVFDDNWRVGLRLPALFTLQREWIEGSAHDLAVLDLAVPQWSIEDLSGGQAELSSILAAGPSFGGLRWFKPYSGVANLDERSAWIRPNAASDTINTGAGADVIYAGAGDDLVRAGAGFDILYGQAGRDQLEGGAGNDDLFGGEDDDDLRGGAGDDRYWVSSTSGHDHIIDSEGVNELALVGDLPVSFAPQGMNALLSWSGGSVLVERGLAREGIARVVWYAADASTPLRSQEVLEIATESGWHNQSPRAHASSFSLRLFGQSVGRSLDFSRYFSEPDGEDLHFSLAPVGGAAGSLAWLHLDADSGHLQVVDTAAAPGIWWLDVVARDPFNASASMRIRMDVPTAGRVWLGGAGDDVASTEGPGGALYGFGGNDALTGGPGSDYLDGGPGRDQLQGGAGSDTLIFSADRRATVAEVLETSRDLEGLAPSALTAERWVSLDAYDGGSGWDRLLGSEHNDLVRTHGNSGSSFITAIEQVDLNAGDDIFLLPPFSAEAISVDGGYGDDIIVTGAGDDYLYGGDGDDHLYANAGADQITGGPGTNWLVGGAGDDTYSIDAGSTNTLVDEAGDELLIWVPNLSGLVTQLLAGRQGSDLLLQDAWDATDVRITEWFAGEHRQIETLMRSDGATLTATSLDQWLAVRALEALNEASPAHADLELMALPEGLWLPAGDDLPGVLS